MSRCLGLAEAFEERHVGALFVGDYSPQVAALLGAAGVPHVGPAGPIGSDADVAGLLALARDGASRGVVIDSYTVGADYLASVSAGAPVVFIDDFAALPAYPCAVIVNFTVGAPHRAYPETAAAKLFGPAYMLSRRSVRQLGRKPVPSARATRVLVALGGVDRHGLSERALAALHRADPRLEVKVVVRPGDRTLPALERWVQSFAAGDVLVGLDSLAGPYAWADACVSGGGLSKYETALLGLPTGALSQTEGEAEDTRRFATMGLVLDLGGPDVEGRPLAGPLEELLGDEARRRALHFASGQVFPTDPTARTADEVLARLASGQP